MGLKICVLASGSSGNSIHIASDETSILIDIGLSGKQLQTRLALIDTDLDGIDAVLISHEHSDHIKGLNFIHKKTSIPIYLNSATAKTVTDRGFALSRIKVFTDNSLFMIGDIEITPFPVMHDAVAPVGFTIARDGVKMAIATDLGYATKLVKTMMRDAHALVIEANHDPQLLQDHSRPWTLKQRIKSKQGHLSNESAAALIEEVATDKLQAVFLAHISNDCNRPDLSIKKISQALRRLGFEETTVIVTSAHRPTDVIEISTAPSMRMEVEIEKQLFLGIQSSERQKKH